MKRPRSERSLSPVAYRHERFDRTFFIHYSNVTRFPPPTLAFFVADHLTKIHTGSRIPLLYYWISVEVRLHLVLADARHSLSQVPIGENARSSLVQVFSARRASFGKCSNRILRSTADSICLITITSSCNSVTNWTSLLTNKSTFAEADQSSKTIRDASSRSKAIRTLCNPWSKTTTTIRSSVGDQLIPVRDI